MDSTQQLPLDFNFFFMGKWTWRTWLVRILIVVLHLAWADTDKPPSDLAEVNCSGGSFSGTDVKELQCLLDDDPNHSLELVSLVAHGESGFVWRGRKRTKDGNHSVIVKFRCCKDMCEGDNVCRGARVVAEMRSECEAGYAAFERAPDLVAACVEDLEELREAKPHIKPFIVLKDVGHYLNAQESLAEFLRQDQLSNHLLLCQLLRAVHAFLDPGRDGWSLVHMDLTTANIMWDPRSLTLQLIDFSQMDFCSAVVATRTGVRGHCLPRHYLKDLKKELVHLAVLADVYGSSNQEVCFKRVRQINFERSRAQRHATDDFVAKSVGRSCSSLISSWTWKFLQWMGDLDRRILELTASKGLIPVEEIFQAEYETAPWSLLELSKIYKLVE